MMLYLLYNLMISSRFWVGTGLAISPRSRYNTPSYTISASFMYDDYDLDYTFGNDYADLDEDTYADLGTPNLDEDYARDGQDYQDLAYRHYA